MVAGVLPSWSSTDGVVEVEYIGQSRLCAPAVMVTAVAYGVAYAIDVAVDEVLYRVMRNIRSVSTVGTILLSDVTIEIHIETAIVEGEADSGFGVIVDGEAVDWHVYHDDALGDVSSAMILAISNHIDSLLNNNRISGRITGLCVREFLSVATLLSTFLYPLAAPLECENRVLVWTGSIPVIPTALECACLCLNGRPLFILVPL